MGVCLQVREQARPQLGSILRGGVWVCRRNKLALKLTPIQNRIGEKKNQKRQKGKCPEVCVPSKTGDRVRVGVRPSICWQCRSALPGSLVAGS